MNIVIKKDDTNVFEHNVTGISLYNGYASVFLEGGLAAIDIAVGDLVEALVYDGEDIVMDITSTFESYQFSMSTYVDDEGVSKPGVTNNSLVFKVLKMHSVGGGTVWRLIDPISLVA